ncbi:MAG: hypothetical protein CUN53_19895, partial [Phototrophicales bacterium]
YGAGTKEFPQIPNLLRVIIGELETQTEQEQIVTVETNIDDMNPQLFGDVLDGHLDGGSRGGEAQGVIQQIHQDAAQFILIDIHQRQIGRDDDIDGDVGFFGIEDDRQAR